MTSNNRRDFLKTMSVLGAAAALPASIQRALAVPARRVTGTIKDVKHIVILMQENRSFDHYFGTMNGVRGFGDRHTVPLPDGRSIWEQKNASRVQPPFHLDTKNTSAMKVPGTPHNFGDAQAAWSQGRFGNWPLFKTDYSMGHFKRADIPFQFALAEAFTICDAYHCSVTGCTDPNRIVFWSGTNFDPSERARGVNCRDDKSEPTNIRCSVRGHFPEPGYTYKSNGLEWQTIPELLEQHGIGWRIYQDPNDNANGLFHACLAFKNFRESKPGDVLYEKGMRQWSLEQFAQDVKQKTLPTVSWILPPGDGSEHPGPSTPIEGADFTSRVLDALTAEPDVWESTVFILTFDENDGFFDHVPPPALPSYNKDGTLAGKATFDLAGEYFDDHEGKYAGSYDARHPEVAEVTTATRAWGLGPRVPLYAISPWSKGGWVNSEIFDHTSFGRFLEKRFDIEIPTISPWHRKMCGDLTSCFDFSGDRQKDFPALPDVKDSKAVLAKLLTQSHVQPLAAQKDLYQEAGVRPSRALPYALHVDARMQEGGVKLHFVNDGTSGATFHVYDKHHLERIPRRYAVEAGMSLDDLWAMEHESGIDLLVLGPNGFMRSFVAAPGVSLPALVARYDAKQKMLDLVLENAGALPISLTVGKDPYGENQTHNLSAHPGGRGAARWAAAQNHGWYDFVVEAEGLVLGFAGRLEDGEHSYSDPLLRT
ncbi:MAG TPA: phospholipase C, phosphocholine-specific [Rhizomicrobium sp.]|jgi:phospholipase C